ncbi:MAG: efflux RND transporter permease subunit [Planctomycetota bacterium]
MSLARFSVRNPVTANLIMIAIIVGGVFGASRIRRELLPNVDPEAIAISVRYPGATPEEVERLVARRVEREIDTVEDVDEIISKVYEGLVVTTVKLEDGADRDRTLADVRSAMDRVQPDLPAEAEEPEVAQVRPTLPTISVVARGDVSEERLREGIKKIRDDLLDLREIGDVRLSGIRDREIWIEVQPEALEEYGLTFGDIGRVLAGSNLDLPAGQLKSAAGNIRVRTLGERNRAAEIESIPVLSLPDGSSLLLRDIATVRHTFEDTVSGGRFQGQPSVLATVFKTPEDDAVQIADAVKRYLAENPTMYGGSVQLTYTRDLSRFVNQRLDLMLRNALAGLALVVLVLALFLEFRIAFWVAIGLTISFLGTFLALWAYDATLNMISMFGLIVVLGLLVDDAIVIAENIFAKKRQGFPGEQAAIVGTNEVAAPVVAAVTTTMIAFAPLGFLTGQVGTFLGVLPVVVICALGVSLIEAFLILPAHLKHDDRKPEGDGLGSRISAWRERFLDIWLPAVFGRILRVTLRWRYVTLAVVVALGIICLGFFRGGFLKTDFIGDLDAETIEINLEMAPGTSERETRDVLAMIETDLLQTPEVDTANTVYGTTFIDGVEVDVADPATVGQIVVELVSAEERLQRGMRQAREVADEMRRRTRDVTGVRSLKFVPRGGGPAGADIEVRLRGDDLETVGRATEYVSDRIASFKGVTEISDDLAEGKLELRFRLRPSAHTLGLTTRDIASQVRHALFGFEVQDLQEEDDEVTVRVLLPESERRSIADLGRMRIATGAGGRVPLEEVADVKTARGYASLTRVDGKRAFTVQASVDRGVANANELNAQLAKEIADLPRRFPGVTWSFEGQQADTAESLAGLETGFRFALLGIYAVVAIVFRSYFQPLLIMAAIPISLLGVMYGHLLMGKDISILSQIGAVALAGIVVNDSLILIDLVNRKRRAGMPLMSAVREGSKRRLRAILLTSVTTIAGLTPLMFERSFQAQFLIPMAISIVFGLVFATVLILVVIPSLYLILEDVGSLLRKTGRSVWRVAWEKIPMRAPYLFVCVENANRSQMAEAFARMAGVEAMSAGSNPRGVVNPRAIESMRELGYDLTTHASHSIDDLPEDVRFAAVVTMGCGDACPHVPADRHIDWDIPDPRDMDPVAFAEVRDLIRRQVEKLVATS